jgi:AraC family transcriptional regulator of adaptative response/methylated-DNA-[protein]-cysteine methyltransferase
MTPTDFRAGGTNAEMKFAIGRGPSWSPRAKRVSARFSSAKTPKALVRDLQDRFPHAQLIGGDRDFEQLAAIR